MFSSKQNRHQRILSPTNSLHSTHSTKTLRSLRLKLPKNPKLCSFFPSSVPASHTQRPQPHNFMIEGLRKQLTHSGGSRLCKALSLKSIASSSLSRIIRQEEIRGQTVKNSTQQNQNQDYYELESAEKDQSRTRSRLTIPDQYGLKPQKKPLKIRLKMLSPKTPKQIRSVSGSKKIIFPIKGQKKGKDGGKEKEKEVNCLEYTFGLQGIKINLASK